MIFLNCVMEHIIITPGISRTTESTCLEKSKVQEIGCKVYLELEL